MDGSRRGEEKRRCQPRQQAINSFFLFLCVSKAFLVISKWKGWTRIFCPSSFSALIFLFPSRDREQKKKEGMKRRMREKPNLKVDAQREGSYILLWKKNTGVDSINQSSVSPLQLFLVFFLVLSSSSCTLQECVKCFQFLPHSTEREKVHFWQFWYSIQPFLQKGI